jgi:hypothetical protein
MLGRFASVAVRRVAASKSTPTAATSKAQISFSAQRRWISDKVALENLKYNTSIKVSLNEIRDAPGAKKKVRFHLGN